MCAQEPQIAAQSHPLRFSCLRSVSASMSGSLRATLAACRLRPFSPQAHPHTPPIHRPLAVGRHLRARSPVLRAPRGGDAVGGPGAVQLRFPRHWGVSLHSDAYRLLRRSWRDSLCLLLRVSLASGNVVFSGFLVFQPNHLFSGAPAQWTQEILCLLAEQPSVSARSAPSIANE